MTDSTSDHSAEPAPDGKTVGGPAGLWQIAGLSPEAVAVAQAAARRSHVPMATWLTGLIHAIADHEEAEREAPGDVTET